MQSGIVIVQQYQRMVVQKFGTYVGTRSARASLPHTNSIQRH